MRGALRWAENYLRSSESRQRPLTLAWHSRSFGSAFFTSRTASEGRLRSPRTRGEVFSQRKHLRIDAVRQLMSAEQRQYIVDDDICHHLAHFRHGAAEMRRQHDVGHLA